MSVPNPTLCLIDGSGYIFRAFYALPLMHRDDGVPTNAVYGFTSMMMNLLQDSACQQIVVVFDAKRENFRNKIYPEYKANRLDTPTELIPQFSLIRASCDALNVKWIEMEGYEADDLIATYVRIAHENHQNVRVISADKDLMQLIQEGVVLHDPMKKKDLLEQDVINKFGVLPSKVIEVQSLMGDSTDNVPGASGIGPKTAATLIQRFGTIENLYTHLDEIKSEKQREKLIQDKEKVFISKKLVSLDQHVPVYWQLSDFNRQQIDHNKLIPFLQENNFPSLIKKLNTKFTQSILQTNVPVTSDASIQEINNEQEIQNIISCCMDEKSFAFSLKSQNNQLTDLYVSYQTNQLFHLSLQSQRSSDLFGFTKETIDIKTLKAIQKLFNLPIVKYAFDIKSNMHLLDNLGLSVSQPYHDVQLMAYNLDGLSNNSPSEIIQHYCHLSEFKEEYFSSILIQLTPILRNKLEEMRLWEIYKNIDLPLIPILFQMEKEGILTDTEQLKNLDKILTQKINELSDKIHSITNNDFNINSPAQLGVILFEQRGLAGGKKGSSGHWITDVKVLEKLAEENDDELVKLILKYRALTKLKSTYIDDLLQRNQSDARIHTTYFLTNTNTGRLASANPNLQNIPIRSEDGKNIRQAFVAKSGYQLLSADYSQIELRLMADVANVHKLKESFIHGEDIHARTASQILGVPLNEITPDQRRQAKAVNFGIIYGISAFGLARNLGISRTEANRYIESYFSQYPEIKRYMEHTIQFVDTHGYVQTPLGRRIYITGLNNTATRQFAHRSAINAPIQGGAADIIKMAMIRINKIIKDSGLDITMLLQVHDELIFEVAEKDIEKAQRIIKENMEKVIHLSVPLVAEVGIGHNWRDAH